MLLQPAPALPHPPMASFDPYALRSRFSIQTYQQRHLSRLADRHDDLPPLAQIPQEGKMTSRVCVVGAGVAGLYTAMIFESLGIQYTILETDPSRVGGKCASVVGVVQ